MPLSTPRQPAFFQLHQSDTDAVRAELAAGLCAPAAAIAPKFLYDALGSRLFEAICELPEYYPTRTEAALMSANLRQIGERLPAAATLVDLGAGNCRKAASLFDCLEPTRYVAVDISVDYLRNALQCLQREYPSMDMVGIGMDFSARLLLPPAAGDGPRVFFYPGSSIGNFAPEPALDFLRQACAQVQGGGLLIGVDLVKSPAVLEPAYDDALGVTAAFNKNLLLHLNCLLGADFELGDWRHQAFYNDAQQRIEMHLRAQRDLTVRWTGGERRFAAGEGIHTENSYKYRVHDFEAMLHVAGFAQTTVWQDGRGWFAMFWAQA